jgi:diguanylate cyclase (GGDEF)-like protein/PAS domain S-box-containing protein
MAFSKAIKELLQMNRAGDVSRELRARLFGTVFWSAIGMMLLGYALWGHAMDAELVQRGLQVSGLLMMTLVWAIWKRQNVDLATLLLVIAFWIPITLAIIIDAGDSSYWLVPQVLLIFFTRFVLNGRIAIGLGIATLATDFVIYAYDLNRYLPDEIRTLIPENDWAPVFISFLSILFLFYITDHFIVESMRGVRVTEGRYRSLFEKTNDLVIQVGADYRIQNINQQGADLLGYKIEELIGKPYAEIASPEEKQKVIDNFKQLERVGVSPFFERVLVRQDGSRCQFEFNATAIKNENGKLQYFQGVGRDLTERKRLEEQLRYSLSEMQALAMQDPLTGLLNRRAITEHAEAEWHRSARERRPMCVVLIDLDNLKDVNDSLGHPVGDRAIIELAAVIKASRRRYDWSGRWGGDEFMLVLPGANLVEANDVAERMRSQYSESPVVASIPERVRPHVSMGVACYSGRPGEEISLTQLISQTDQALYQAKQSGKNRVELYRDEK